MVGWLARLIGRSGAGSAPPTAAAAAGRAAVAGRLNPVPDRRRAASAPAAPAHEASVAGFGARRPLVGARGGVAAFELLLPPAVAQRLRRRGDANALAAHQAALLAAASPVCQTGRAALVGVTVDALCRPGVAQQAPPGAMLCVDELTRLPALVAAELRARQVRLGQAGGLPAPGPSEATGPDFVLLHAVSGGLDTLLLPAQRWQQAHPRLPLVATGLLHLDDVERVLRQGFQLAGGQLARAEAEPVPRPLSAPAHRICRLLNHLLLDHDTAVLAEALRGDAALSYRLLRYANSPALGLRRSVDTLDEAVQLLGRRELQRWLQVLLLNVGDARQASRALQEAALARGRLLETLAAGVDPSGRCDAGVAADAGAEHEPGADLAPASPATLFTVGLLSMLEVLLQVPLSEALAPLHLSPPVQAALLQRTGPYAAYLALADALESTDPADIDRLDGLVSRFGGIDTVCAASAEAWAWAAGVAQDAAGA